MNAIIKQYNIEYKCGHIVTHGYIGALEDYESTKQKVKNQISDRCIECEKGVKNDKNS